MQMSTQPSVSDTDIRLLRDGEVPEDAGLLKSLTVGTEQLSDFLSEQYLRTYIAEGGSKIKFITGRSGSGKTHFSRVMLHEAYEQNYRTVRFSAKDIWLHDFREIYLEILKQCDIELVLEGCARQIILEMGYDPSEVGQGRTFMDLLSEKGEADPIARGEIRGILRKMFTRNPLLDNNFACCCSLLTGGILGHPVLETASRDLLLRFLHGDKTVKLTQLRALGLSPSRITKFNARNLLRSLAEVVHLGGFTGLLVMIDDMEMLLNRSGGSVMKYTKLRREDTYESIRQLIDDIDSMHYIMFLLCFDRELMDNDSYGMKSYQALWMRIQNEVVSVRFNKFADILDLDRCAEEFFTDETLEEMAERLGTVLEQAGVPVRRIPAENMKQIREQAVYGSIGLPYLVNRAVQEGEENV